MNKILSLACLLALTLSTGGRAAELEYVQLNQDWLEDRMISVDVEDTQTIFQHVFDTLPEDVLVYPTENYFYFKFWANGRPYSGNFRLHPEERDQGLIHFAYFDASNPGWFRHALLGDADGVEVERVDPLSYRVRFDQHEVTFRLNALDQSPDGAVLRDGENFIGRGFDESGFVFQLIYNEKANRFLWVLDPDQQIPVHLEQIGDNLHYHVQSRFTFLRTQDDRHVLIGVHTDEVARNSWYDGPFDQLPDNWIEDTSFYEHLVRTMPGIDGQVNRRGEMLNSTSRVSITPYIQYASMRDILDRVQTCQQWNPAFEAMFDCTLM